jgi:phytoene synthase
MQLTNIARDVGEDARSGRLYLPLDWLREAGIDADAFLAQPTFTPALGTVIARLLAAADVLYDRAAVGIDALPARVRAAMHAARLLYAEIGRAVERQGLDSVSSRAYVPWTGKARVIAHAIRASRRRHAPDPSPALPAAQFLVTAAAGSGAGRERPTRAPYPWQRFEERVEWTLALFERLELEERAIRGITSASPLREAALSAGAAPEPTAVTEPRPMVEAMDAAPPWYRIEQRVAWTLELFERLERHQRGLGAESGAPAR